MTTQEKKRYKSTGAMLKAGDFDALIADIEEMKAEDKYKEFTRRSEMNPISSLDDILFYLPQYAVKTVEHEDGTVEMTKEILPRAIECLELILKDGANPNAYMKNGENAYLKACEIPTTEILDCMLNSPHCKVDLTHTDGMGNTGMFYATMSQSVDVLDYLVNKCEFNVNEKNFLTHDSTYIHYACGHAKEKSFDKLMELGANPTIKDGKGYQPFELMLPAYDPDIIEEYSDSPEELKMWSELYSKVTAVTEDYRSKNKIKLKTKF